MATPLYETVAELDQRYVLPVYRRQPIVFVRGAGARLYDDQGNAYLDFLAGIAVCSVGHCHPHLVQRICEQAGTLMHTSNFFLTEPQARLAQRLCALSGMEKAFFCNSGAEACELGIKIARKFANAVKKTPDYEILTLEGSFHGRTMGALSATMQAKYQEPFKPLLPGFRALPRNDLHALRDAFSERTAAILLEPIQGEGGIHPIHDEYLQEARHLCDRYNALLIVDEVQAGFGRTGKWFAYQHAGVLPDVVAVAKGLGGGFPVGACLMRGVATEVLQAGEHGTTYGGNPLACSAALAVIEIIEQENLLENAACVGAYLQGRLRALQSHGAPICEVRGRGLMVGVELTHPVARTVFQKALARRLILNAVSDTVLRIVPPLVITQSDVDESIEVLAAVFQEVSV
ncbi:MAG: aspartate aminotransferase family protein [Armatimonadetes bacterium JP3_11]|nr:MAG: aspartate aminotransferase family protein [Armatimonadetes bacterium JP3_11]RMH09045.1 MAG: acetylornithine transaminase [Armatimonadota bacterium]